jgi:hypothetical protein
MSAIKARADAKAGRGDTLLALEAGGLALGAALVTMQPSPLGRLPPLQIKP